MRTRDLLLIALAAVVLMGYSLVSKAGSRGVTADDMAASFARLPGVSAVVDALSSAAEGITSAGRAEQRALGSVADGMGNVAGAAQDAVNCSQCAAVRSLNSIKTNFQHQARSVYASIMETKRGGYCTGATIHLMADENYSRR